MPGTRRGPGHKALLSFHILVFTRLTYKHKCSMTLSLRVRAHQRIRMCTVVDCPTEERGGLHSGYASFFGSDGLTMDGPRAAARRL